MPTVSGLWRGPANPSPGQPVHEACLHSNGDILSPLHMERGVRTEYQEDLREGLNERMRRLSLSLAEDRNPEGEK